MSEKRQLLDSQDFGGKIIKYLRRYHFNWQAQINNFDKKRWSDFRVGLKDQWNHTFALGYHVETNHEEELLVKHESNAIGAIVNAHAYFSSNFHDLKLLDIREVQATLSRYERWFSEITVFFNDISFSGDEKNQYLLKELVRYFENAIWEMKEDLTGRVQQSVPGEDNSKLAKIEREIEELKADIIFLKKEIGSLKGKKKREIDYLIDGTNVCQWHEPISLVYLLFLLTELITSQKKFFCIFDANTRFSLGKTEKLQREAYEFLLKEHTDYFDEVTGGIKADDFILHRANKQFLCIISNDRYRDYLDKFKWLQKPERLVKGKVMGGFLTVPDLSINIEIEDNLDLAMRKFRRAINK